MLRAVADLVISLAAVQSSALPTPGSQPPVVVSSALFNVSVKQDDPAFCINTCNTAATPCNAACAPSNETCGAACVGTSANCTAACAPHLSSSRSAS